MCGFKFERESGRDFSLELRELVLAFEDMITTFTTLFRRGSRIFSNLGKKSMEVFSFGLCGGPLDWLKQHSPIFSVGI